MVKFAGGDGGENRWPDEKSGLFVGICHDNPATTPAENIRFDACISVPEPVRSETTIGFQPFPAGTYAAVTYHGLLGDGLGLAYRTIAEEVANSRRHEIVGIPGIEIYQTPGGLGEHVEHCVDVLLPVSSKSVET